MSARGDLTGVIYKARWVDGIRDTTLASDGAVADAILAAGYRKPRTITTAEELDKLAVGTIVMDSDPDALLKTEYGSWRSLIDPEEPFKSLYLSLPATVLHEPEAT